MTSMGVRDSLRIDTLEDGALWRIRLNGSKGNIIDMAMLRDLAVVFADAATDPAVKVIVLEGCGKDFSYGASVEEHLPEQVGEMLPLFHDVFRKMLEASVFTIAAVRGRCLGGGLELASFCHRVVASRDALVGQPEIVLGVFAPIASFFLAERVGRAHAEDLCLSGRIIDANEGKRIGLIDEIADEPRAAALEYAKDHLLPHSAASLRLAAKAIRLELSERFDVQIERLERLFLDDLMTTADAQEGIQAFIEKRKPTWRNP